MKKVVNIYKQNYTLYWYIYVIHLKFFKGNTGFKTVEAERLRSKEIK